MRTVIDNDFVADIETNAQRAYTALQTATWIEHSANIRTTKVADVVDEVSDGDRPVVDSIVDETTFENHEGVNVVVFAEVHFGTKLAVDNAHAGTPNDDGAGTRRSEAKS